MTMTIPRHHVQLIFICLFVQILFLVPSLVESQQFDPYQQNGGLVCAVAGRNYCIVASDTRMTDGGYQIYSRSLQRIFPLVPLMIGRGNKGLPLPNINNELIFSLDDEDNPCTLIAAAGCEADCNALERVLTYQIKAHLQNHIFGGSTSSQFLTKNVAQLLSTTLYSRRNFPYYSFCVVGGLDPNGSSRAYVYDAIGSMEQVAVATAGNGRELLQPILDRLFSSSAMSIRSNGDPCEYDMTKTVDCTSDEAIELLTKAYHAVAERDIGVGDSLVFCLLSSSSEDKFESRSCRILRVPLKTH